MNLNEQFIHDNQIRMAYTNQQLLQLMSDKIISWLPSIPKEYVVICIGTDRSTGDALGPLTGTFLNQFKPKHMTVYGTLHKPVHATNLQTSIDNIYKQHYEPFIIAIDACLGKVHSVGQLICGLGSIKPGAALNKPLPSVGDLHITGVVNIAGFMEYAVLQNTRLSLVTDMAEQIATILNTIDEQLTYKRSNPAVLLQHYK